MKKNFVSATVEYSTLEHSVPSPYLRKTISLSAKPEAAELKVSGLGFYRLFVNGKDITKGHLAPYISNPEHICYYDTYDIAELLTEGKNVLGFRLGNGLMNNLGGGVWDFDKFERRGAPRLAFELSVSCDGEELFFDATEGVVTHPSGLLRDDMRYGEIFDARAEIDDWAEVGFDDSPWTPAICAPAPGGALKPSDIEPIEVIGERRAVSITEQDGGFLYDFGINTAGVWRLRIRGERGQKLSFRHGEFLLDGKFYDGNISGCFPGHDDFIENQTGAFICSGGEDEYTPSFCYFGFRYLLVKGITKEQATEDLLTYLVMSTALRGIGGFSCSDERINTLWGMVDNANRSNYYHFPTDCPHREKNGWTGDASLSSDQMMLQYDTSRTWRQWLDNIRAAQTESGSLPGIVPTTGWGYAWGNGPTWDSVLFNLPYMLYKYRGELDAARESSDAMLKYLRYVMTRRDERGLIAFGLGDWVPVGKDSHQYDAPLALTDSVMVMDISAKAAEMLRAIGESDGARYADDVSAKMRDAVRRELVDPDTMVVAGDCQSSQAIALYYGIFDKSEDDVAFAHLVKLIHDKSDTFDCGFIGMHCIFHVLSEHGEDGLAFRMITHDGFPSYTDLIKMGHTAMWEHFIEYDDHPYDKSLNHHFLGDISRWFMTRIAGLNPVDACTIRLTPSTADGAITSASAYYDLPKGRVEVSWTLDAEGEIDLTYTAPEGVKVIK